MAFPKGFKTFKQRGEWVELLFMTRAAALGLNVSTPYGDSARYDVSVEANGSFLRVQVKSTDYKGPLGYSCSFLRCPRTSRYTADELDFFAAYIIPMDVWYIIPVDVALRVTGTLLLNPSRRGQRYQSYMEAWHLLREKTAISDPKAANLRKPAR